MSRRLTFALMGRFVEAVLAARAGAPFCRAGTEHRTVNTHQQIPLPVPEFRFLAVAALHPIPSRDREEAFGMVIS